MQITAQVDAWGAVHVLQPDLHREQQDSIHPMLTGRGEAAEQTGNHLKETAADDGEGEDVQDDAAEAGHLAGEVSDATFPAAPLRNTPGVCLPSSGFCAHCHIPLRLDSNLMTDNALLTAPYAHKSLRCISMSAYRVLRRHFLISRIAARAVHDGNVNPCDVGMQQLTSASSGQWKQLRAAPPL